MVNKFTIFQDSDFEPEIFGFKKGATNNCRPIWQAKISQEDKTERLRLLEPRIEYGFYNFAESCHAEARGVWEIFTRMKIEAFEIPPSSEWQNPERLTILFHFDQQKISRKARKGAANAKCQTLTTAPPHRCERCESQSCLDSLKTINRKIKQQ